MVTNHAVTISGLAAGTTYYYQVQSTDSKSNNGKSGDHNFATVSLSISGAIAPSQGGSGATVTLSGAASARTTANSSGAYTFTGLASGSYSVTPSNAGYSFTPANQNVSLTTSNTTSVNFTATASAASPSITTQPANQSVTAGQTATFTVVASGATPLGYQWQKNGTNLSGATSSTYTTPATTTVDSGSTFRVVVTNSAGTATSNAATLMVNASAVTPTITTQPANQTVTAGQTATFAVVAAGTSPLSYQWQKNGANISGATSSSYTTPATTAADSGTTFLVAVTNSAGSATSNSATLTVSAATVLLNSSTTSLNFGNVNVGSSSVQNLTLTNSGNSNVTISSVNASGTGYSASGVNANTTLTPGQTATVNVTFAPTDGGSVSGSVSVASNASNSPATISLSGSGVTQTASGAPICGKSGDSSNHIPTDWNTFLPPAKGQSYVDATFGCTVTRITDASKDVWTGSFYLPLNMGYATVSPFNANDTWLMLADGWQRYFITDLTGNMVVPSSNMPVMNQTWVMWDAANPSVFYYTQGNSMMKGTISSSTVSGSTIHQFTEYSAINFMAETDVSQDGEHVVIISGDTSGSSPENVFDYNFAANTKGPVYTTSCVGSVGVLENNCLHKLIQTADNNVIIEFASDGTGPEQGNRLWDGSYPLPHLQDLTNHLDAGYDVNGNAVFIESGNSYYTSGLSNPCPSGWGLDVRQIYNTSSSVCLLDNPPAWHVGYRGNAQRPWVGLSFFDGRSSSPEWFDNNGSYAAPTSSTWQLYEDEIIVARIDANNNSSNVYRVARAYSRSNEDFYAQPHAAISRDGRYLAFNSNMAYAHSGCPANFQMSTNCTDVYIVKVK
jgi:hypothetical protein